MNIITQPLNTRPVKTPETEILDIKKNAKQTFDILLNSVKNSTKKFWDNKEFTPTEMAEAAGTDCVELFTLHEMIVGVLETANPGCAADVISLVGAHTKNNDGTITITPSLSA
jgi:hypothetical protein